MSTGSDVRDFVERYWGTLAHMPTEERVQWLSRLDEEVAELHEAVLMGDQEGIAHESVDVAYTVAAMLARVGIDWDACWAEIHRANMGKRPNPTGGKPLKPPGWQPADLTPFIPD